MVVATTSALNSIRNIFMLMHNNNKGIQEI